MDTLLRYGRTCVWGLAICALSAGGAAAQDACPLEPAGAGEVAAARDGRTLMLRDGRELRLAAIETPPRRKRRLPHWPTDGKSDAQKIGRSPNDRYWPDWWRSPSRRMPGGRCNRPCLRPAKRGFRLASATKPAPALFGRGAAARAAQRGLWANPNFAPLPADNVMELGAKRGQFVPGRGQGLVGARKRRHDLHEFRAALVAAISPSSSLERQQRAFAAAGVEPKRSKAGASACADGSSGVVARHRSLAPEQIEILD